MYWRGCTLSKTNFRKKCKKYYINEEKRLCVNTKIKNCFDKSSLKISCIVIEQLEIKNLIKTIHEGLSHIGINRLD